MMQRTSTCGNSCESTTAALLVRPRPSLAHRTPPRTRAMRRCGQRAFHIPCRMHPAELPLQRVCGRGMLTAHKGALAACWGDTETGHWEIRARDSYRFHTPAGTLLMELTRIEPDWSAGDAVILVEEPLWAQHIVNTCPSAYLAQLQHLADELTHASTSLTHGHAEEAQRTITALLRELPPPTHPSP